jgi:tetratricopeptide (TPR) repeat protein
MKYRAQLLLMMMLIAAVGIAVAQRSAPGSMQGMQGMPNGSLSGHVRAANGSGIANARVELHATHGTQSTLSTYTNSNGGFEFANLATGDYEIIATQGLDQVHDHVSVSGPFANVDLQMNAAAAPVAGSAQAVSVAEMKIPEKARNHFRKAEEAMRKGRYDEVSAEVEKSLQAAPNYANALTLRAVLRLDSNHAEQALDDLQTAIHSDPNYAMAYIVCGAVYNFKEQYDNAVRSLERGIGLDPTSWQGYFELSKALLAKQEYEASLRNVNRALELVPKDYSPIHLVRAHIYLGLRNYDQAMTELEAYLEHASQQDANAAQARKTLDQVRAFVATKK